MKFAYKRIGALLLALMLTFASLGGLSVTANAEETETVPYTDSYVLNYSPEELTAEYPYNVPFLYTTPFMVSHTALDANWNEFHSGPNHPVVFNLINTTKLADGGEGAYASIPAYCTDASTGIRENATYRRINLEDSTYYQGGAAGKIRAVVLNSFPRKNIDAIQARANSWLRGQGQPEIVDLQSGEAILATQTAIWELANGDHYTVDSYYAGRTSLSESHLASVVDTSTADQLETDYTAQNVESLYNYLTSLDAIGPQYDAVSEASLENPVYTAVKASDGTYTVTVRVDVNTRIGENDTLTLSATCGDLVQNQMVAEAAEYEFVFEGLADREAVKLELNGYQCGGDVYLFDALGERDASQTLVGYDDSKLPVHGEVTVTPDRVLNIFKSTSPETGKMPLANIVFDIYRVATMAQLESGEVTLSAQPTAEEIAAYKVTDNLIATLMTDVQGFATYNFTENGQPDGVYMIVEQFSAATTGAVEPFFLTVPGTTEDGSGYSYTLNINPKNVTETGPDVQKDITKIDNNSDTYDVGETHTWIIRGGVPSGIANAQKYVVTDVMDYRLTYEKGSPKVMLYTRAGTEVPLELDNHYTLSEGTVSENNHTVDRFSISLTADGMSYVAANLGSGDQTPEIRVYFSAVINENAIMGTIIPNNAHLDYTNSAGVDYDDDSDVPEVHIGGINLLKTDSADVPLAGATFRIARQATDAEIADETIPKETLIAGGEELTVIFADFHATADMSGEKVSEVTTGEDGKAVFYGLAYGTYYLVETKAPAGYNLLTEPITVEINAYSHLTGDAAADDEDQQTVDNTIHVINTKFILPETGGMGTTLFTVIGVVIIAAACILLFSNRKKRV